MDYIKKNILVYFAIFWGSLCIVTPSANAQSTQYNADVLKEAASLEQEGWKTLDVSTSIAEQLYDTRNKKYEIDSLTGSRRYVMSSTEAEGASLIVAQMQASMYCQNDIAGQISSWVLSEAAQQLEIKSPSYEMTQSITGYLEKRTSLVAQQLRRLYKTQEIKREVGGKYLVRMTLAYEIGPLLEQLKDETVSELRNMMGGWSREYENILSDVFKDASLYNKEGLCDQYDEGNQQKAAALEQEGWHSLDVPIADQLYDTKCKKTATAPNTNTLLYVTATAEVSANSFLVAQALADNQCKSEIAKQINTWVIQEAVTQLKDKGINPEMQNTLISFFSQSTTMVAQQIRRIYRTLQIYRREGDTYTLQMTMAYELAPLIDQFRDAAISELRNVEGWSVEYEDLMYSVFSGAKSYNRK